MAKSKFTVDDDVYVLDVKEYEQTTINVIQKRFNAYTDSTYETASLTDGKNASSTVIVKSYAIFGSKKEASKFAILHLIDTKEPHVDINIERDISIVYTEIMEHYPELILKYMKNIVNL